MIRNILISLLVGSVCQPLLHAGERLTPERLWQLTRLGSVCLSPDGNTVAYVARRYNLPENQGRSEIHVLDLQTQQDRLLIGDLKSADALQFATTSHGLRLLYVAVPAGEQFREATPQVWSTDLGGAAPLQVTAVAAGVSNLKVSPTSTHLAFTSEVKLDRTVNELYPDLPLADARIIDSLMYRHWDSWHDYAFSHVHVARLNDDGRAGEPVDLMRGLRADCPLPPTGGAEQFNWSPDGREIAYTAKIVNDPAESTDSDIYVVPADGSGSAECLTPGMNGFDTNPVYAPDGSSIAFHSMQRAGFEADKNRILLFDRASKSIRDLTAKLDQTTHDVTWLPDSQSLVFMSEFRGCDQLFCLHLQDEGITQISRGTLNWSLRGVLPDGQTLLVDSQSMLRPQELELLKRSETSTRTLTHLNDDLLRSVELPQITERWVTASDGQRVHCWVIYPPGFDPLQKWPLITYCQGGPQSQVGQWFSYRWNFHLMAAKGYVIVAPNRRGLPGFGSPMERSDQRRLGWTSDAGHPGGHRCDDGRAVHRCPTHGGGGGQLWRVLGVLADGKSPGPFSVHDRPRRRVQSRIDVWLHRGDLVLQLGSGWAVLEESGRAAEVRSVFTAPVRWELAHTVVDRPWRKGFSHSGDAGYGSVHGRPAQRRTVAVPVFPGGRALGAGPAEWNSLAPYLLRLARSPLQTTPVEQASRLLKTPPTPRPACSRPQVPRVALAQDCAYPVSRVHRPVFPPVS